MLSATKPVTRKKAGAPRRDPERTRALLLKTAFAEVYRSGFQGTGLDRILDRAKVTKGALYYHFGSKEALGYALVDEVILEVTRQKWLVPLEKGENPIDTLIEVIEGTSLAPKDVEQGCPLNNISQEMAPLDEEFRKRTANVFRAWIGGMADALKKGQKLGQVRKDIDAEDTATYVAATYEGYISLAKNAQDPHVLRSGIRILSKYLETLRPAK